MSLRDYQTLEQVTAPLVAPITVDEVKDQLFVSGDTDFDVIIARLIAAAVSYVDGQGVLGRPMITQSWAQLFGASPSEALLLMNPVQALVSVEYYDTDGVLQTATLSDYELSSGPEWAKVAPISGKAWPPAQSRDDAIKITFTAGYGDAASDVPDAIRQALLMLVAHWFENRESTSDSRIVQTPFGFHELINTQRSGWYA